ncbi:hypothetical protein CerSpe_069840 [Prunus speciosa]
MKIVSWNVRGLGDRKKRAVIKKVLKKCGAYIVMLQETKKMLIDRKLIGNIWGSKFREWICLPSIGSSGGILIVWNTKAVKVKESLLGSYTVSINCADSEGKEWWLTGVYGPNGSRERPLLWEELADLYGLCDPNWCIGGDFNITRFPSEKSNGGRFTRSMRVFNDFIRETHLCDPHLHNAGFTWSNMRENAILRRLDRFLFTPDWEELFPHVRQEALPKVTFDHCPILLDLKAKKWGPVPFKFENLWLKQQDFRGKFKKWWEEERQEGWEGFKFMKKLKAVKGKVKDWSKETSRDIVVKIKEVEDRIKELDSWEERGQLSQDRRQERA